MSPTGGPLTISGIPGPKTFNIGFQPKWLKLYVCAKVAGPETANHTSYGRAYVNPTPNQYCHSTYSDDLGPAKSFNSSSHIIRHYERDASNNIVPVLSAALTSFNSSGFTLNADIVNNNYQVYMEAGI